MHLDRRASRACCVERLLEVRDEQGAWVACGAAPLPIQMHLLGLDSRIDLELACSQCRHFDHVGCIGHPRNACRGINGWRFGPIHGWVSDDSDTRTRLARAESQIAILESMLRDRSKEATRIDNSLRVAHEFMRAIYRAMPGALFVVGETGTIEDANDSFLHLLGARLDEVLGESAAMWFEVPPAFAAIVAGPPNQAAERSERVLRTRRGDLVPIMFSATPLRVPGERRRSIVCVAVDISERKRIEADLRQAQKLESVGRLAAGVAHEINTPLQFVSDSVRFLREAADDLFTIIDARRTSPDTATGLEQKVGLDELAASVPEAFERAIDGLGRVATIVRSLNLFAHPHRHMVPADLTEAIRSTVTVATSEYKMIADVELDLEPLPLVECQLGEINQVVLNLVINASHAIADAVRGTSRRGRITVRTRAMGDHVSISISDTGGGIPDSVRERIFDPFFTTKEIGRGTGQGLAIARTVICELHGGEITFDTEIGAGTTFHLWLPVARVLRAG